MNHFMEAPTKCVPLGAESIRLLTPAANRSTGRIHEITVDAGVVILVLFQHVKTSARRQPGTFAG